MSITIKRTLCPTGSVENSDATYSTTVDSGGSLVLPDSQINVNGVDEGDVVSVKTIDVNITDGSSPVTPDSVSLNGNILTVAVPSGGGGCITEYGEIFSTDFAGSTLPTGLTNTISSTSQSDGLTVNSGSVAFTEYLELDAPTGVQDWELEANITIDSISGTTYGFGLGIGSTNGFFKYEVASHFVQSAGGYVRFVREGNVQFASNPSTLTFSVGHVLRYKMRKVKKTIYTEIYNLTNGSSVGLYYDYNTSSVAFPITSNTGKFRLYSFAGGFTINSLSISNLCYVGGVIFLGDSVTSGYCSTSGNAYNELVNYPYWNVYGGSGDKTSDLLLALNQLTTQSIPDVAIIMIGLNDQIVFSSAQYQTNLESIVTQLQTAGVTVKIIAPTPKNTGDMTAFANAAISVATTYGCDYINGFTLLKDPSTTNINAAYNADGIHPNDAGHLVLANAIIANF